MDRMSLHQSWHRRRSVNYRCALGLFVAGFPALVSLPEIKPETLKAWDEYIQSVDVRIKQNADGNVPFLWIDQDPVRAARVRHGEVLATPGTGADGLRAVPYGLIHDWVGAIFIPGVTAAEVFSVVHNYDRYSEFYRPGVVDAALIGAHGNEERFRIRYAQKVLFESELLDSEYAVSHVQPGPQRWYSVARSTRLQEVRGQDSESAVHTNGSRYLWRIFSVSKYEQRDGGVYVEEEDIVLSRAIPASIRWLAGPVIRHLSHNLIEASLRKTREAVRSITVDANLNVNSLRSRW